MATVSEMFNTYVKYFPTIDKTIKLIRGGKIRVTDNKLEEETIYESWDDLNSEYKQVDGYINEPKPKLEETIKSSPVDVFKVWTFGDPYYNEEIRQAMSDKFFKCYGKRLDFKGLDFKKPDWVYMIGPDEKYIETRNDLVIFLLENSKEWEKLKLPIKQFTKEDIAKLIGIPADKFEII